MVRNRARGRLNQVRRHRRAAELTQADLAEQVGVSRQTIVALEAGDYAPSVYLALALADTLGTSVEVLFDEGDGRR
ncbi:MAG: helix-turn-helix transcriptional regulator [Acidimicrobiales bacterium]